MTDSELLELAAKAAGIGPLIWHDEMEAYWISSYKPRYWNPLTDDADALRLAVKLHLEVTPYFYFDERCQTPASAKKSGGGMTKDIVGVFPTYQESLEKHDPYAATRRAIVRAAAALEDAP